MTASMTLGHTSKTRWTCSGGRLGQRTKWVQSIRAVPDVQAVPNNERGVAIVKTKRREMLESSRLGRPALVRGRS